jgi:pantoate--beta-alanine ligase
MVRDLDVPIEIRVAETVRESDGLALSSRNQYLDPAQRKSAPVLYRSLEAARTRIASGERDAAVIRSVLVRHIESAPGAILDYAAVVNADTLQPVATIAGATLLALAVRFGSTRLIDNVRIVV